MKLILGLIALFVCAARSHALTLVNPSFEEPLGSGGYADVDPVGWIVSEPAASFQVSLFNGLAQDGAQSAAFNASNTAAGGTIWQTLATVPGSNFDVTFWTTANVPAGSSLRAEVFDGTGLGGSSLGSVTSNPGGGGFVFTATMFSFTATSAASTIAFTDISPTTSGTDLFLDNVTVVPEPSAIFLLGLVGVILSFQRRRR